MVIAHDVDPIELVVFLPLQGKAHVGTVVHKKMAAILAIQEVRSKDQRELATLVSAGKANLYVSLY